VGCESDSYDSASDWWEPGDDLAHLKVPTVTNKFSLVGYQDILYTNRGMVGFESPLVSPQKIWIVNFLSSFQPNALFYQELMGGNREFDARDQQNGPLSTPVIPVANACNAVSNV